MLPKKYREQNPHYVMFKDLEVLYQIEYMENLSSKNNAKVTNVRERYLKEYETIMKHINKGLYDPCMELDLNEANDYVKELVETKRIRKQYLNSNLFQSSYRFLDNSRVINSLLILSTLNQEYFNRLYMFIGNQSNLYFDNTGVLHHFYHLLSKGLDARGEALLIPDDFTLKLINSVNKNRIDLYREMLLTDDEFRLLQLKEYVEHASYSSKKTLFHLSISMGNKRVLEYLEDKIDINAEDEFEGTIFDAIRRTENLEIINKLLSNPNLKGEIADFVPYLIRIGATKEAIHYMENENFRLGDIRRFIMMIQDAIGFYSVKRIGATKQSKTKTLKDGKIIAKSIFQILSNRLNELNKQNYERNLYELGEYEFDEYQSKRLYRNYDSNE